MVLTRLPITVIVGLCAVAVAGAARDQASAPSSRPPAAQGRAGGGPPSSAATGAGSSGPLIKAGMDLGRLARIDTAVAEAIAARKLPGAVVLVGRGDTVVWQKAYGDRALVPAREAMTLDTMFDLASLTKVVATTTAAMMLVEDGTLRLSDTVATYIPEFAAHNKGRITIRDLMTHMSGLRGDLDLTTPWSGYDEAIRRANNEVPTAEPGRRFVYSDINFFVLADVVARASHRPFAALVRERIFGPLGMRDTMFTPPASLRSRIAPTEQVKEPAGATGASVPTLLRGVVHDPTARRMGGVAGHAGLFSTAADLSVFCRMLLGNGAVGSVRVLAPLTVARMTSPATPAGETSVRGLGWDLDSAYSSNRGDLLPLGSFGHTGFTGTSIWVDPATRVFVVFLSNRVHPDATGDVTPLRSRIASVVAASLVDVPVATLHALSWPRPVPPAPAATPPAAPAAPTLAGIDVLRAQNFAPLRGLRVGLLTNHTGRARDGAATIDLLAGAPGVRLVALFSPEHGIRGILDASVPSTRDDKTGLPIHSLYGATERPTSEMLEGIDAIVIDLQDVGARFYTYSTTMAYVLEAAAPRKIKVVVLDRPDPIGGAEVEGPSLDEGARSFTGYFPPMPIRHGLTMGELARLFNGERQIGADLTVIAMEHWRRAAWFDETGLAWINPSPNMRNLYAATLYPGIGAFEFANLSVGRGTDTPFEQVGAPWIDGARLAEALNARPITGVRFYPVRFTPTSSKFANQDCGGVFIVITDRNAVQPVRIGVEIASALVKLFPGQFDVDPTVRLFGSAALMARIKAGEDPAAIASAWAADVARWRQLREKYLLY